MRLTLLTAIVFTLSFGATEAVGQSVPKPPDVPVDYMPTENAKLFYEQNAAVFIDVRGRAAYEAEHIKGALEFGLTALREGKVPPVPKDMLLITYCGCPHSMAAEGAKYLKAAGFKSVYVLDEGYYYWKDQGLPVKVNAKKSGTLRRMQIRGTVPGVGSGTPIYARHAESDQWEAGAVDAAGSFELHLPFYGVADGAPVVVSAAGRTLTVPFSVDGVEVELTP